MRSVEGVGRATGLERAQDDPRSSISPMSTWRTALAANMNIVVSLVMGGFFAAATVLAFVGVLLSAWVVGVGVVVRAAAMRLSARLARADRRRLARLGYEIEPLALPETKPEASFRERQLAWGRATWLWRLPAYQLARPVLAGAVAFVTVGWWWSIVVAFLCIAGPSQPVQLLAWKVGPVDPDLLDVLGLVAVGLLGIGLWPNLARGALGLDALLARALLGPSRSAELAARVSQLSNARDLAIESVESERRRIERDLHDGLQPQLVSLALDLGLARSRLQRDPEGARSMIERAHDEAKRATKDLRNLVRGIHPAVLEERGLDAALSALVAGCPVPVTVDVSVPDGFDPVRQATAYYVIAEALTNITKYSGAHYASIIVSTHGTEVRVRIEDDGEGGAHLSAGGGLAGLAARLAAVDGALTVTSPSGGPTRIEAVIPCAS